MNDPAKIAVVGASGFVGRSIVRAAEKSGHSVVKIAAPRLEAPFGSSVTEHLDRWLQRNTEALRSLTEAIRGCEALVNAAGLADPTSAKTAHLWGANAVLPSLLERCAELAEIPRFVHVSSAAVLGDVAVLDERAATDPISPYAKSKAEGERALEESHRTTIYRPTSVLGEGRNIVEGLSRILRSRYLITVKRGAPLPIAMVENVGAVAVHLATVSQPAQIILHPWEGVTAESLALLFGRESMIPVTPKFAEWPIWIALQFGVRIPLLGPHFRRAQLLWFGQKQHSSLESIFTLPYGTESIGLLRTNI
jgi:nucleoside-diphosphate-sugar epimerase